MDNLRKSDVAQGYTVVMMYVIGLSRGSTERKGTFREEKIMETGESEYQTEIGETPTQQNRETE